MCVPAYSVLTTSHFDRLMKKLAPKHPELVERFERAIAILASDPYNKSGKYAIKKLVGVAAGEGQYRLRSGRFRFRDDIAGLEVVLHYLLWAAARGYVLTTLAGYPLRQT